MAESSNKHRGLAFSIMVLFMTELAIIFLVVPNVWVKSVGASDRGSVQDTFGTLLEDKLLKNANTMFNDVFVRTKLKKASYDMLINKWDAKGQVTIDDRGLTEKTKNRLDTFWDVMGIACYRLSEMFQWLIVAVPLFVGFLIDASTQRKIHKWQSFAPSPLIQVWGKKMLFFSFIGLFLIPLAPFQFFAFIIPTIIFSMSVFIWILVVNTSKHV